MTFPVTFQWRFSQENPEGGTWWLWTSSWYWNMRIVLRLVVSPANIFFSSSWGIRNHVYLLFLVLGISSALPSDCTKYVRLPPRNILERKNADSKRQVFQKYQMCMFTLQTCSKNWSVIHLVSLKWYKLMIRNKLWHLIAFFFFLLPSSSPTLLALLSAITT